MLQALGQWVVKHRLVVVIIWVLLLLPALFGTTRLHHYLQGEVASGSGTEMNQQEALLNQDFPDQRLYSIQLVIDSADQTVDAKAYQQVLGLYEKIITQHVLSADPLSYRQSPNQLSQDRRKTFIFIGLNAQSFAEADVAAVELSERLNAVTLPSGFQMYLTGGPLFSREITTVSAHDSFETEERILPLIMLVLIFAFGGLIAAGIPMIVGVFSTVFSLGILCVLAQYVQITSLSQNIVTMLGLGVGIDYSLLFVSRYREELLEKGLNKEDAAIQTVIASGRTILYSGTVVSIGLMALLVPNVVFMRSLGMSGLLVVAMTILISLTLVPALLAMLGDKINWPKKLSEWTYNNWGHGRFWSRWARYIMSRPLFFSFVSIGILISISLFALEIKVWNPTIQIMPKELETRQGYEKILEIDPSNLFAPMIISFETRDGSPIWQEKNIREAYAFMKAIQTLEPIRDSIGLININEPLADQMVLYNTLAATGGVQNLQLFQPGANFPFISTDETKGVLASFHEYEGYGMLDNSADLQTIAEVREFRDMVAPHFPNIKILVGGLSAIPLEMKEAIFTYFPMIVLSTVIVTYLLTMFSFGSILLPLKAVLLNLLSVTATYGCMILVFQRGFGAHLLGLKTVPGALLIVSPLILFCIIFGLSMDYEIFLINRIKEEYEKCGDPTEAIAIGMEKTGGIITNAGLIMILVFSGFAFARMIVIKEFGFGLAVAIFIDATIIRMMIVPALMKLFGHSSWYFPKFLDIPFLRRLFKE